MLGKTVNKEFISKAIEEAEKEREQLLVRLAELEEIKKRLSQIDLFIENGKALIGLTDNHLIGSPSNGGQEKLKIPGVGVETDKPLHLRIIDILKENRKPMRLRELANEFQKRKWKLSPNNPKEVLRNTIKNKPNLFTKNDNFEYWLKDGV